MRILLTAIAGLPLLSPAPAAAFWQRSHFAACAEAQNESERLRLRCWIFAPAYEWPIGGSYRSLHGRYGYHVAPGEAGTLPAPHRGLVLKY
ncbi:hypothetical protein ASG72_07440 [Bosea sp. Leaf344]|uniref:hypothetical protein n=1 Tax=Bosea sp. Leaf344 TaxID=1736346 RepID=UPI0006F3EF46|nr:hypothetical protein [Bosea sp. Leaf344]KQU52725.1 hypothetical protein ASG72_07440 [Bosea sp. Leaf344]